jgi:hypothetical protein
MSVIFDSIERRIFCREAPEHDPDIEDGEFVDIEPEENTGGDIDPLEDEDSE